MGYVIELVTAAGSEFESADTKAAAVKTAKSYRGEDWLLDVRVWPANSDGSADASSDPLWRL